MTRDVDSFQLTFLSFLFRSLKTSFYCFCYRRSSSSTDSAASLATFWGVSHHRQGATLDPWILLHLDQFHPQVCDAYLPYQLDWNEGVSSLGFVAVRRTVWVARPQLVAASADFPVSKQDRRHLLLLMTQMRKVVMKIKHSNR